MNKIETRIYLPFFTGFYQTLFDVFENIEVIHDSEDELEYGMFDLASYENIDWKKTYINLSKEVVSDTPYIGDLMKKGIFIDKNFGVELHSPKEYNRSTDKISVDVSITELGVIYLSELIDNDIDGLTDFVESYDYFVPSGIKHSLNQLNQKLMAFEIDSSDIDLLSLVVAYLVSESGFNFNEEDWSYEFYERMEDLIEYNY